MMNQEGGLDMNSLDVHYAIIEADTSLIKRDEYDCVMNDPHCTCRKEKRCNRISDDDEGF